VREARLRPEASGLDTGTTGRGTIDGTGCPVVAGTAFTAVGSVFSVGNVEYPNETTIVGFDRAITCAYLSTGTSWDDAASATIPNGTQFLRLTLDGGEPRTYPLSPTDPPAPGSHAAVAAYYQTVAPGVNVMESG